MLWIKRRIKRTFHISHFSWGAAAACARKQGPIIGDRELVKSRAEFRPHISKTRFEFRRADPKRRAAESKGASESTLLVADSSSEAPDFSAQISHFSFLTSGSGPGLEFGTPQISHFSFLVSDAGRNPASRLHVSRFSFLVSYFSFPRGARRSQVRLVSTSCFSFLASKRASVLEISGEHISRFSFLVSRFSQSMLLRNECRVVSHFCVSDYKWKRETTTSCGYTP